MFLFSVLSVDERVQRTHPTTSFATPHVTGKTRPGDSYPTRLTTRERDLIRTKRGTRKVVDEGGTEWEIYEFDSTVEASWGARRTLSKESPAAEGELVHGNTACSFERYFGG